METYREWMGMVRKGKGREAGLGVSTCLFCYAEFASMKTCYSFEKK